MTEQRKKQIADQVVWLSNTLTQSAVAARADVSTATISQVVANNWRLISKKMWMQLEKNLRMDLEWIVAPTDNLKEVYNMCHTAQERGIAICISDKPGKGKSNGYKYYNRHNSSVIYVECKSSWTKKEFLKNLLMEMGKKPEGTFNEMLNDFNKYIKRVDKPLLILDQADKLKDPQFDLFMEFYNDHEGHLGMILSGVKHIERRIDKGVQRRKMGYAEIFSRIGSKYIELNPVSLKDVVLMCKSNGLDDKQAAEDIYHRSMGDLRRVRREIIKLRVKSTQPVQVPA